MNHIDLFSGCGGFGLGFHEAGYELLFALDFDKDATETYKNNLGGNVYCEDISAFVPPIINQEVDVITAGFPCQPFSSAGDRKGFEDNRAFYYDSLFAMFKQYNAKFIVLENVKGFVNHDKGRSLTRLTDDLGALGYTVTYKILNAYEYGVPQKRERVIIVCNRTEVEYEFPEPTEERLSLWDAIHDVDEPYGYEYTPFRTGWFDQIPEGGNWKSLKTLELQKEYMKGLYRKDGGATGALRRLDRNKPSLTLLCTPVGKMCDRCHPIETRPLNIREYARIQTFPDTFKFVGSRASQYRQIGNAIPVRLARIIANSIKKHIVSYPYTINGIPLAKD